MSRYDTIRRVNKNKVINSSANSNQQNLNTTTLQNQTVSEVNQNNDKINNRRVI